MNKLLFIISIGLLMISPLCAQENPKIEKYLIISKAPDEAKAQKEFATAEKYYKKGKGTYDEALKYYLRLHNYYEGNDAMNYKIGICYLFSSDKKSSLQYLLNSVITSYSIHYTKLYESCR